MTPWKLTHALCLSAALTFHGLAVGVAWSAPLSTAGPAARLQEAESFFVRAGAGGARVLNFQDVNASLVRLAPAGTLMRVHKEDVGFYNVEVEGGLEVWVHGKFLEPTAREGVLRCIAWGVLMRPGPGSTVENMPITVKLQRGDLVRKIELADPEAALDKTWVKVWSPLHARAWVKESSTVKVDDAGAAEAEWDAAASALAQLLSGATTAALDGGQAPQEVRTQEASTQTDGASQQVGGASTPAAPEPSDGVRAAFAEANELYAAACSAQAGFAPVVAAYEEVVAAAPVDSLVHGEAQQRLEEAKLRYEIEQLEAKAEAQRRADQEKLAKLRREREKEDLRATPDWGRFDARGWIQAVGKGAKRRYLLHWDGEVIAEIQCSTGRYDLAVLEDFEVGLKAVVLRAAMPAREASFNREAAPAEPKVLDVTRIEVISARR